jgi:CRISPR-associated protein Csm1
MTTRTLPTCLETALGGFFQDIGKFMQRAHGSLAAMDRRVRNRESVLLPAFQGRYSHKHVLWSDAFFQWMEDEGLSFPKGINLHAVRDMAVFHHKPDANGALGWLAAEADRLSSGMDRKTRDENLENQAEDHGWMEFIKTPMLSPFSPVDLGLGKAAPHWQNLTELRPDERLLPLAKIDTERYPETYSALWQAFCNAFRQLCRSDNAALFCEGLLSLSERYTWAIPSSTIDQPDISLHDHNRTVAAIAGALHQWHTRHESLQDERAIRDRDRPKFRLLAGDLSGIQRALFALSNQQVKGVNKILRARSFMLGMLTEGAVLLCRQAFALPVFNLIQNAGGRFVLLLADVPEAEDKTEALRQKLDDWIARRYLGELALNLALTTPFAGTDLLRANFHRVQANLNAALEETKQRPLRTAYRAIRKLDYAYGACAACGVRPVERAGEEAQRCAVCEQEYRIGAELPRINAISWQKHGFGEGHTVTVFDTLVLTLHRQQPHSDSGLLSAFRLCGEAPEDRPWARRFLANYVPVMGEGEDHNPLFEHLSEEARQVEAGEIKLFEHLAQHALETGGGDAGYLGKPFLAILKADVDRLGFIFGVGLRDTDSGKNTATLSRFAALSRMLDLFFTGYLQQRLRDKFPHTYTVYAGGDDLLLIGPWRQMIELACDLNREFRRYTGHNPNITLSAGLELMKANQPLNRTVWGAEERLEAAKEEGEEHERRNRICLIDDRPIPWKELPELLAEADRLTGWLRDKLISAATVYRLLYFAGLRRRAEHDFDMTCADWRARWCYHLARNVSDREVRAALNRLLGLTDDVRKQPDWRSPRTVVSIALYRNRT